MNRRKFLTFMASAPVAAHIDPSGLMKVLAPVGHPLDGVVEYTTGFVPGPTTKPITLGMIDEILNEMYKPSLVELLNRPSPFLQMMDDA